MDLLIPWSSSPEHRMRVLLWAERGHVKQDSQDSKVLWETITILLKYQNTTLNTNTKITEQVCLHRLLYIYMVYYSSHRHPSNLRYEVSVLTLSSNTSSGWSWTLCASQERKETVFTKTSHSLATPCLNLCPLSEALGHSQPEPAEWRTALPPELR